MVKRNYKKLITMIMAIFLLVGTIIPPEIANGGVFCGSMGTNMQTSPIKNPILENLGNRTYTIKELFQNSIGVIGVHGEADVKESDKDWFQKMILKEPTTGNKIRNGVKDNEAAVKRLEDNYNPGTCLVSSVAPTFTNLITTLNSGSISIAESAISMLFNPENGITKTLANVIGGKTAAEGRTSILGSLGNNLFLPLSIFAFILTGLWLLYTGIVKREFRAGLQGVLWALIAFALGITVTVIPHQIITVPNTINSTVASCILSSMNGGSCTDSNFNTTRVPDWMEGCVSNSGDVSTSAEATTLKINSLTCVLWKTFILESYSQTQFGRDFAYLNIDNLPAIGGDKRDYKVNLYSTTAPKNFKSTTVFNKNGENSTISNFATYLLSLKTEGKFNARIPTKEDGWIKAFQTASLNETIWNAWTSGQNLSNSGIAILQGFLQLITMIPLIVISFYGLIYAINSVLALALSPIFLLFAIHPGRGRKIFLGWLESWISYMLKYFASTLLIVIGLNLYAAVLGSIGSMTIKLISGLILSLTLLNYRKEFTELMGQTSMGGTKMKNIVGEKLDKTKRLAVSTGAGAVGGLIAGDATKERGLGSRLSGVAKGAVQGAGIQLKRGTGFGARMMQTTSRLNNANANEMKRQEKEKLKQERTDKLINKQRENTKNVTNVLGSINDNMTEHNQSKAEYKEQRAAENQQREQAQSPVEQQEEGKNSEKSSRQTTRNTKKSSDYSQRNRKANTRIPDDTKRKTGKTNYTTNAKNAKKTDSGLYDYQKPVLPDLNDTRSPEEISKDEYKQKSEIQSVNNNIIERALKESVMSGTTKQDERQIIELQSKFKQDYQYVLDALDKKETPKMNMTEYNNLIEDYQKVNQQTIKFREVTKNKIDSEREAQERSATTLTDKDIIAESVKHSHKIANELKSKLPEELKEIDFDKIDVGNSDEYNY